MIERVGLRDRLHGEVLPVLRWAEKYGLPLYVVSASPELVVRTAVETLDLPFEDVFAMSPAMDGDRIAPRIDAPGDVRRGQDRRAAEGRARREAAGVLSATARSIWPCSRAARIRVAVRPKPELRRASCRLPGRSSRFCALHERGPLTSFADLWDRFRSGSQAVRFRATPRDRQRASFWYAYGGKNREVLERLLGRFHRESTSSFIDATFQGDYFEALAKLRTAIAARAAPAMSHVVGEVVPYLAEAGVLEPLDGYEGARGSISCPRSRSRKTYVGGDKRPLVAVPFNRSTPIMYVNKSMLERAGVAPPTDWNELRAAAKKLTRAARRRHAVWGFECPVSGGSGWRSSAGGRQAGRRGRANHARRRGRRARARALADAGARDRVMQPPLGRDYNAWQVAMQDFLAGRAAMIWSSTAFFRYVEENARFEVRAAPLPGDVRRAVPTGGTFFVLLRGAGAREKKAAWEFCAG